MQPHDLNQLSTVLSIAWCSKMMRPKVVCVNESLWKFWPVFWVIMQDSLCSSLANLQRSAYFRLKPVAFVLRHLFALFYLSVLVFMILYRLQRPWKDVWVLSKIIVLAGRFPLSWQIQPSALKLFLIGCSLKDSLLWYLVIRDGIP